VQVTELQRERWCVLIAGLLAAVVFQMRTGDTDRFVRRHGKPMLLRFNCSGALVDAPVSSGLPMHRGVFLTGPGLVSRIKRLSTLRGMVTISSPASALQFVRLGTDLDYMNEFQPKVALEIVDWRSVDRYFTFGDVHEALALRQDRKGYRGIVNGEWMKLSHVPAASVRPCRDGWEVGRSLIVGSFGRSSFRWSGIFRLTERVRRDGTYTVLSWHRLKVPWREVRWAYPEYE
jgi:hypothetical protein